MANEVVVTVVGNVTADPTLRFTGSGVAVVDFTVASSPRVFDRNSGEWKTQEATFFRCSAWREMAENIADSLAKGMRVVVTGKLQVRSYQTRDTGETRQSVEIQVDEVGPSLRYAKAQVTRNERRDGGFARGPESGSTGDAGGNGGSSYSQGGFGAPAGGQPGDPWGQAPAGGSSFDEEPPF